MKMKNRSILTSLLFGTAAAFLASSPAAAQIEVPVSYELASGAQDIDGFLTGGSWCEDEGLSVTKEGGTAPTIVRYEDIDEVESLSLCSSDTLSMKIRLKDAGNFHAKAVVPPGIPLLILRDEVASGTAPDQGKVRTFTPENFRGLPAIEFEAAIEVEADPQAVKELADRLGKAALEGNFQEAIDLHSQIGELLDALTGAPDSPSPRE